MSSRPAIRRRSVDLPQPEGPSSTTNFPDSALKVTPIDRRHAAEALGHFSRTISDTGEILSEPRILKLTW
jgi:hypothetical protein